MTVYEMLMWFTWGSIAFVFSSAGLCYYLDKKYNHKDKEA